MAQIVGKTLVAKRPFHCEIEPWMLTKSLSHHFLEQRSKRRYPGFEDQIVLVNAKNPDVDFIRGRDMESLSRFKTHYLRKSIVELLFSKIQLDKNHLIYPSIFLTGNWQLH
jgi:hypothetical protein